MGLDIRLPLGLLFTIIGVLLAGYGLVADASIYERSLGINVNLWWGLAMLLFGAAMLVLARRRQVLPGPVDAQRDAPDHERER